MASYRSEQETRERIEDRLRQAGADKRTAQKQADASVGRVVDNLAKQAGKPAAERDNRRK